VGGKDKIIDISGSFDLVQNSKSKDIHLYFYNELYHDIWNEEEIFDVNSKITDWINMRI